MAKIKFTAADICHVTGYNRDQLRGLLQKLPPYADHPGAPRVAREFSRHDLLVLSVVVRLEMKHGLQRAAIASVVDQIHAALRGPRPLNSSALLIVSIDPPSVTYLATQCDAEEGTVVALAPVFQQVDGYLDSDSDDGSRQPSLPFGPSIASRWRHG